LMVVGAVIGPNASFDVLRKKQMGGREATH
jgi:hypothetical protein